MDRAYLQISTSSMSASNVPVGIIKLSPMVAAKSLKLFRSVIFASLITLLLVLGMSQLIATDYREPAPDIYPKVQPIHMPETVPTVVPASKPVPPTDVPNPVREPQVIADPQQGEVPVTFGAPPAPKSHAGPATMSADPLPIYKPAPRYPNAALRRGIQGYVVVEFTITSNGSVRDPSVVGGYDSEGNATTLFDRAALKAVERFKYRPPMDEGRAVERSGVRNRISFKLAE